MTRSPSIPAIFSGVCLAATLCCIGCQTDVGGVTTPSEPYLTEGIEYYPTGPKFKLTNEAAAIKAFQEQQAGLQVTDDQTPATNSIQPDAQPMENGVYVSAD